MENSLRIVLWNANELSNHKLELENFLQIHKINTALISEMHFTTRTMFKIPYYKVYHDPHPDGTAHGGASVIIRSAITYHELLHNQSHKIKAASIQVDANPCMAFYNLCDLLSSQACYICRRVHSVLPITGI
jgi:hypothetical protein